ncbi:Ig-like domain-containing protein [Planococcus dechangensis]|uniref:Ig-like domain-containing protein n=2 Tax=Planococcus dechangensis TaxID=1176255 RepID=A0ABV9MAN9_9BACL
MPNGNYSAVQLYRNSLGEFEGTTVPSPAGEYTVASIMVLKKDSLRMYFDRSEDGEYEFDEWNFTSYAADTTGPELDNLYVDNPSIIQNGNVTVTVEAHDDLSDVQSMYLDYKAPNGYYYQLPATNVGNNRFQVQIPSFMTSGLFIGEFECVAIIIRDSRNNTSHYIDDDHYSNRNLDAGNFTVKPEGDAPVLKSISIDKGEVDSEDSLKVIAEVEDASGVANVKVNYTSPMGYNVSVELMHAYGNVYEGEFPAFYTGLDSGKWKVQFVWMEDIYKNALYAWSNSVHWWGDDLSGGDFVVKEKDTTPPEKPELNEVSDVSTVISGWAEPYSTIDIFADNKWIGSTTVFEGGYFSFDMPAQKAGTRITVTATDSSNNSSEQAVVIVKDATPPEAPHVDPVSDADTVIYGQAESDSTITVSTDNTVLGNTTTDTHGNFSVRIPKQKAGTKLQISAADQSGNSSETTQITVVDATPPGLPTVHEVTDASTKVTGIAEANAVITIYQGTAVIGQGEANDAGQFSVAIPKQPAASELEVTATDNSGNVSAKAQVIVKDRTSPSIPTVNEVTDKSLNVTGKVEARALVTVKKGTTVLGTGNATAAGDFTVPIVKQTAGTALTIVAADAAGNVSKAKEVIVKDKTAPNAPTVQTVTDVSTSITGTAEIGSSITVKAGTELIGSAVVGTDGRYSIAISKLKSGLKLQVTATDAAGNTSEIKEVTVVDTTAPSAPIVNKVTDQSTSITGNAEANAIVSVKAGTQEIGSATVKADGTFAVAIAKQKAGVKLSITARDAAGNTSTATLLAVSDATAPAAPTVDAVTDQSETMTGTAEADSTIRVKTGTTEIGTAKTKADGTFVIAIAKQKADVKLSVTAVDAAGNISEATVVTVADTIAPAIPVIDEVTDQSVKVTGTAEAVSTVSIKVGLSEIGSAKATADGKFSIAIAKQTAGTKLTVTAADKAGNISKAASITVKDATAPNAPIVDKVTHKATSINGAAEAGSDIVVTAGTKELVKGKTASNGKFSLAIEPQSVGTELTVVAIDAAGNQSAATKTIVVKAVSEATDRISGSSRYLTAIAISQEGWQSADTVILATATDFPDALAGGPLAFQEDAPILLTKTGALTPETKKEIQRLGAKKVIVLGRAGAISAEVEAELKRMNLAVERIGGQTRFDTAALIAGKLKSDKAVVANGLNFPDVLSVSSYAAKNGIPILLTRTDRLPEETKTVLTNKTSTYVIGSTGAVSEDVLKSLPKPTRLGGKDRYETGYVVATTLTLGTDKAYIATGMNFPDALAGSVLAAKNDAPILLVRPTAIPEATNRQLPAYDGFSIFGGTGAVSDGVKFLLDEELKK